MDLADRGGRLAPTAARRRCSPAGGARPGRLEHAQRRRLAQPVQHQAVAVQRARSGRAAQRGGRRCAGSALPASPARRPSLRENRPRQPRPRRRNGHTGAMRRSSRAVAGRAAARGPATTSVRPAGAGLVARGARDTRSTAASAPESSAGLPEPCTSSPGARRRGLLGHGQRSARQRRRQAASGGRAAGASPSTSKATSSIDKGNAPSITILARRAGPSPGQRLAPARAVWVDVEHREAVLLADARAQQAHPPPPRSRSAAVRSPVRPGRAQARQRCHAGHPLLLMRHWRESAGAGPSPRRVTD